MALEWLGVQGLSIAHSSGSPISGGAFVVTSTPSTKAFADGKGIYKTPLAFTFSGGNASGFVPGSIAGSGVINATSTKMYIESILAMREGDTGTLNATGTLLIGGTAPVSGGVEISNANQQKWRTE